MKQPTIITGHMGCVGCRRFVLTKFNQGWQAQSASPSVCPLTGWGKRPDLAIRNWWKQHKQPRKVKRVKTLHGDLLIMGKMA